MRFYVFCYFYVGTAKAFNYFNSLISRITVLNTSIIKISCFYVARFLLNDIHKVSCSFSLFEAVKISCFEKLLEIVTLESITVFNSSHMFFYSTTKRTERFVIYLNDIRNTPLISDYFCVKHILY